MMVNKLKKAENIVKDLRNVLSLYDSQVPPNIAKFIGSQGFKAIFLATEYLLNQAKVFELKELYSFKEKIEKWNLYYEELLKLKSKPYFAKFYKNLIVIFAQLNTEVPITNSEIIANYLSELEFYIQKIGKDVVDLKYYNKSFLSKLISFLKNNL